MSEQFYEDPVVAEIHAIRAKMLADCGGDHRKLMEQVIDHQRASGRKVIPLPPAKVPGPTEPVVASGGGAGAVTQ